MSTTFNILRLSLHAAAFVFALVLGILVLQVVLANAANGSSGPSAQQRAFENACGAGCEDGNGGYATRKGSQGEYRYDYTAPAPSQPYSTPPPTFNPAGMPRGNAFDHGGRNPYDPGTWSKPDPSMPFGGQQPPYPW
jgi:hypothetical protein